MLNMKGSEITLPNVTTRFPMSKSMTNQQQDLVDTTFAMAQLFSDIKSMKRIFLIIDQKTLKISKTEELSDKHFTNAIGNKTIIVDLKSQQVFDYGKRDWQDISEEHKAGTSNKKKSGRAGSGSGATKKKKRTPSTNRKA